MKATKNIATVSIGLPVYNGEKYLREALESILAQTFGDFELIISDNASTDRTREICRAYASRDSRIRYYRSETNTGAAFNFNRVFELSTGEYFKWASHDDICDADFLLKCVEVLDRDPSVVLCFSRVRFLDEYGSVLDGGAVELNAVSSMNPKDRFAEVVLTEHGYVEIWGLMRSYVLKRTPLIDNFYGSDRTLLSQISLFGRFHRVPQYLFYLREHPERSVKKELCLQQCWIDPDNQGKLILRQCKYFFAYLRAITHSPLTWSEKIGCYRVFIGAWFSRYWRHMGGECKIYLRRKLGLQKSV